MEIYPTPPPSFCKKLHEFDRDLRLNWDPNHRVWAIWHDNKATGKVEHIMNVVEPDGSYRPLDDRAFRILTKNAWYVNHPKELEKDIVDKPMEDRIRQEASVKDDLRHLAKDKSLKRRFDETVEKARSVPWDAWTKEQTLSKMIGADGKPMVYTPHTSITDDPSKPIV